MDLGFLRPLYEYPPDWPASGNTDAALEFGSDGPVVREQFRKVQLDIIEAARTDK